MTMFLLGCVLMVVVAIVLIARPLLHNKTEGAENSGNKRRNSAVLLLVSLAVVVLSSSLYLHGSNWQWSRGDLVASTQSGNATVTDTPEIRSLVEQIKTDPENATLLVKLGSAYVSAERFAQGAEAYQRAYELTKGQDLDAITGWAEALVLADPSAVNGHASVLIEEALKINPRHPRALWYGGLVALQMQNLSVARDRFQTMLELDPPDSVRKLLERQVQDLNDQLGATNKNADTKGKPDQASDGSDRKIVVQVKLSPALQKQLKQPVSLFVLARNPEQPGAPLAVQRHQSDELPLKVELTVADAMLPTRTLKDAQSVEVVARLSASGMPTEQSGDLYGVARYSFARQGAQGNVSIEISQRVP